MSRRLQENADDCGIKEEEKGEEEGDNNGVIEKIDKENFTNKNGKLLFGRRVKGVVFSPINKIQKIYKRYKRSSSSSTTTKSFGYSSCLCISKSQTLDTDYEGIDPSDPNVCYDQIKYLIEKNDFFCKECNTHFGD